MPEALTYSSPSQPFTSNLAQGNRSVNRHFRAEKIAKLPPQPVILSEAKNPAHGAKTFRFAQGDKTEFCNRLFLRSGSFNSPSPLRRLMQIIGSHLAIMLGRAHPSFLRRQESRTSPWHTDAFSAP